METKEYEKLGIKSPHEIQVYIPKRWMKVLNGISGQLRMPISQILMRVLANPKQVQVPDDLTRPHNFHERMHRFPMRFAADHKAVLYGRIKWARFEFGPYLRFLLEHYIDDLFTLIQATEGLDLAYTQTNTVETKSRQEVYDHGHKWHIYSYEMWAYIPETMRHENFPSGKLQRSKDEQWYDDPVLESIRKRHNL